MNPLHHTEGGHATRVSFLRILCRIAVIGQTYQAMEWLRGGGAVGAEAHARSGSRGSRANAQGGQGNAQAKMRRMRSVRRQRAQDAQGKGSAGAGN